MMWAVAIEAARYVAIEAQDSIPPFGEVLCFNVSIHLSALANTTPMLCTIVVDMIDCQKLNRRFATALAGAAIGSYDFFFEFPIFDALPLDDLFLVLLIIFACTLTHLVSVSLVVNCIAFGL